MPNVTLPNGAVFQGNDTTAMGTLTSGELNRLIKKYTPYDMMVEEARKQDYFLSKVNVKDGWKGGQMDISFKASKASSRRFGRLIHKDAINEATYGLGAITKYKELWGAMVFNQHDLLRHDSIEQSLIKILPEQLDDFMVGMKEEAGRNFLNNNAVARVLSDPATDSVDMASGILKVTRPENFEMGQRIEIGVVGSAGTNMNDGKLLTDGFSNDAIVSGYVSEIHMQDGEIILVDDANAAIDLALAGVDTNNGHICTIQGGLDEAEIFSPLDRQLLADPALGGSTHIFGLEKSKYPYTQAFNFDGSTIDTGAKLVKKIFESMLLTKRIGKGAPTEAIMSNRLLAGVMSSLQNGLVSGANSQGAQYFMKDTKASLYGWTEIEVFGVEGSLKLVGVNDMEDNTVKILDWRGIDLHTNGLFEKDVDLDGNEYTTERTPTGKKYIVDIRMFGELVVSRPSYQGIIHSIPSNFQV